MRREKYTHRKILSVCCKQSNELVESNIFRLNKLWGELLNFSAFSLSNNHLSDKKMKKQNFLGKKKTQTETSTNWKSVKRQWLGNGTQRNRTGGETWWRDRDAVKRKNIKSHDKLKCLTRDMTTMTSNNIVCKRTWRRNYVVAIFSMFLYQSHLWSSFCVSLLWCAFSLRSPDNRKKNMFMRSAATIETKWKWIEMKMCQSKSFYSRFENEMKEKK